MISLSASAVLASVGSEFYQYLLLFPGFPFLVFVLYVQLKLKARNAKNRQPFESQPRPPGWSLQQRVEDTTLDGMFYVFGIALFGLFGAGIYTSTGNRFLFFLVGGGGSLFCLVCGLRLLEKSWNNRLGLKGELLVGARLEELRSRDCLVFHDLEFNGKDNTKWNIDHVLLGPSTVFVVETKCRRKSREHNADGQKGHEVIFDGTHLIFPFGRDTHGLDQARRNAEYLKKLLEEQNAIGLPVEAVLVLPGWFVKRQGRGPVRVVNEKELAQLPLADGPRIEPRLRQALAAQLAKMSMT